MRVTIIAPGSRGDIQPYLALGLGLVGAGHQVRVVTTLDHQDLVQGYGLEVSPIELNVQAALQRDRTAASIEGGGLVKSFREFADIAKRGAEMSAKVGLEASKDADAVLTGFGGVFIGEAIAHKRQIPLIQAYNVPLSTTVAFGGALFPRLSWGPWSRRLGHRLTREGMWMLMRSSANAARMKLLECPSAPLFAPTGIPGLAPGKVLYGYSSAIFPEMPEWAEDVEVTGHWFADEPQGWTPPPGLEEFLTHGPQPICIGFGSMSQTAPEEASRLVAEAVERSGQRAVVLAGWGDLTVKEKSNMIYQCDNIPHAWLYPRVRAIVHHGGAGTTAAGFRAGAAAIVVPFHGDQFFWAKLVHDLGIGPEPIPRTRLSAKRLAQAIMHAVTDDAMAQKAADLGARIRKENGVARAVAAIERIVGQVARK